MVTDENASMTGRLVSDNIVSLPVLDTYADVAKVTDDNTNLIERLLMGTDDSLPLLDTGANIANVSWWQLLLV